VSIGFFDFLGMSVARRRERYLSQYLSDNERTSERTNDENEQEPVCKCAENEKRDRNTERQREREVKGERVSKRKEISV
jgi:hypothetical protein